MPAVAGVLDFMFQPASFNNSYLNHSESELGSNLHYQKEYFSISFFPQSIDCLLSILEIADYVTLEGVKRNKLPRYETSEFCVHVFRLPPKIIVFAWDHKDFADFES